MAYSTTYTDIKTDLINLTDEDSAEFLASIDAIIGLAESQCLHDLDLEQFQQELAVGNTVSGTRTVARPATLLKANSLWVTVAGEKKPLRKRTYDYCQFYAPTIATLGEPVMYAELNESSYYLVPSPDAIYAIGAYGLVRPAGLGSGATPLESTWLSVHAGDLLLYACLVGSEQYLSNKNQISEWKTNYTDRLAKAKVELRGIARDDYLLSRPASQTGQPL